MTAPIAQYIRREEARAEFARAAVASWIACQETGEHLTGAEGNAWLDTSGT
jgi:predicted transcriptional regulator